jgi:hypothetical protein
MSDTGAFKFYSWLQRGIATQIVTADGASGPVRAAVTVALKFNNDDGLKTSVDLDLHGPGEVANLDARAIVRVWPPPNTRDAAANYFPLVEFDQADLPWRYTPRSADASQRLRPWMCLIVLRDEEIGRFETSKPDRPLPIVTIIPGTPLPLLEQSWAWAHVQVSGDASVPVEPTVRQHPERCLARLLCPRRLDARTAYTAMLVPVFEIGRLAGLRQRLPANATLGPSWTGAVAPEPTDDRPAFELPVYYRWHFSTGESGDFESLVRQLKGHPLPDTVGTRPLDVGDPGGGLPAAASLLLPIGGALRPPTPPVDGWPEAERNAFVASLAERLNLPDKVRGTSGQSPVVAPPLYGKWHARRERLAEGAPPSWFQHLNADPRRRIAAALGTQVVQARQQELMASAWEQVGAIREINDQLRKAQLARAIGDRLHGRFIKTFDADTTLLFTAAVHLRVLHRGKTVHSLHKNSPVGVGLVSGPMRRLLRPRGSVGRRQGRADRPMASLLTRVNDGTYVDVLRWSPPPPSGVPTHGWLGTKITWRGLPSAGDVSGAPKRPNAVVWDPAYPTYGMPTQDPGPPGADSPSMAAFREAALAIANRDLTPQNAEPLRQLDTSGLRTTLVAALDPRTTIPAGLGTRLTPRDGFAWAPRDPLDPIMAAPEFPQPMYAPLAEISQEWVLPGLSQVPANTATVARPDQAFIEAYLIGLNHEMARELLWSEYPTDQRGSYFRQFWDIAGYATVPTPDAAKDISPLHLWGSSELGTHSPRPPVAGAPAGMPPLVLVVRAEVLRRYPSTLVYAVRAKLENGRMVLDEPHPSPDASRKAPLFGGRLQPDTAFFGFDLEVASARGSGSATDAGWFFVFEEQPGEPRFGLDVPVREGPFDPLTDWNDLTWAHLAGPEVPSRLHYIDLADPLPLVDRTKLEKDLDKPVWHLSIPGSSVLKARGADHAAITLQKPVRVAIHASEMI